MLRRVLDDLLKHRAELREALDKAAAIELRKDYIDCWNLVDEIQEHDRRIEVVRALIREDLDGRVTN